LAFGLGTLPNLLLMGVFAARLSRWMGRPAVRITAGLLVMAFGLLTIARGWLVAA
ncbi:MAG: sulfite exporter TauE/SafE family protein, partial [Gammaproteobacteria bacterium]